MMMNPPEPTPQAIPRHMKKKPKSVTDLLMPWYSSNIVGPNKPDAMPITKKVYYTHHIIIIINVNQCYRRSIHMFSGMVLQ